MWGGYLSPVADAYSKPSLAPAQHRVEMCRLAAQESDGLMVDAWEAGRPGYTRTLQARRGGGRWEGAACGLCGCEWLRMP